ncbi:prenyltransferase [Methanosarcina sp. 2.H.T.1A.6]|uniref:UbiA family prenyltransferase n=1 Tax=unclassified Methanosarcina TaxID=2644672 RepID=UPI000621F085|nr:MULTISPECIES: UbiA family prenyltransferase [unclassified Methanosarcina]KKG10776.1 prenyltransferase [Methanosarcina sp. 2.H.T.1A.15]KKG14237.1 prenyltransferase [Methanosarcina sp. 2.H.T.1A.3]KKG19727.1 prenyltransferase [Methanosarcina sp. 2.H.T.1A.6]KKG27114.1 prenyltransferase [Methanosarcina sp. 2.H.T.1A.8]
MSSNEFSGSLRQIFKHCRTNNHECRKENATAELLKSSILVAFSGALRIHLAFLLLHIQSSILTCIAGGLIIYTVYTLDRALGAEEDTVNRKELNGSNKKVGLAVSLLAFIIGTYILAKEGILTLAFIPFITGYLYSKGIKIGKFALKLKGGLGIKNIVVGLTWGIFIAGLAGSGCGNLVPIVLVFIFFGVKLFINSAIYDFKDIKGDTLAGIKTLPVSLGTQKTRNLLTAMHLLSHLALGIALIHGVLAFEPLIILYSFICGLICIQNFTNSEDEKLSSRKLERTFLVDGESTSILGLRMIASALIA